MKTINTLRYFLFALMVLGMFASFAQNNYGLTILYYSQLFIGIIFLIEAFVNVINYFFSSKVLAFYLFFEHLWIAMFFICSYLMNTDANLPAGVSLAGMGFVFVGFGMLLVQYLIFGIFNLIKYFKKGIFLSVLVFCFFVITIYNSSIAFSGILAYGAFDGHEATILTILSIIMLSLILSGKIKKLKFNFNGEKISFIDRLNLLPGKSLMIFFYFLPWMMYFLLLNFGIAPSYNSLSKPAGYEKLLEQNQDERAQLYLENYKQFIINRELEKINGAYNVRKTKNGFKTNSWSFSTSKKIDTKSDSLRKQK